MSLDTTETLFDKITGYLVTGLLVLFTIGVVVIPHVKSAVVDLFLLIGIVYIIHFKFVRKQSFDQLPVLHRYLLWSFAIFYLLALLSAIVGGIDVRPMKKLAVYIYFLYGFVFYFLFVKTVRMQVKHVWLTIAVSAVFLCVIALLQKYGILYNVHPRAQGDVHPIRFGDIALLLGVMSLAGSLHLPDLKQSEWIFGILACFAGLLASLLSMSRGGWVALPVLLGIMFYKKWGRLTGKTKIVLISLACALPVFLYFTPGLPFKQRIHVGISDVKGYEPGKSNTSLALRFEMFRAAWKMFKDNPVLGIGVGQYNAELKKMMENREINLHPDTYQTRWHNPHNEFLLNLTTRGIFGLVALLALFIIAILLFWRAYITDSGPAAFLGCAGLLLILGYMQFGLSIALFEHRSFTSFFVIFTILFAALIAREAKADGKES